MAEKLETRLSEETFNPRHNIDLAEVFAYLGLLKEKSFDNGYRVGIVTKSIFGLLSSDSGFQYGPGQVVIIRDSKSKPGTLLIGNMPNMYDGSVPSNIDKMLNPNKPIDEVPNDYIREVI